MKPKPCKLCGSPYHTAMACPTRPRKPLQTRTRLVATKPMNKTGKVAKKTAAAVAKWKRTQAPNHAGYYRCYICGRKIDYLMAEHVKSKVRRPDLRTDPGNFQPVCGPCNESKGSISF